MTKTFDFLFLCNVSALRSGSCSWRAPLYSNRCNNLLRSWPALHAFASCMYELIALIKAAIAKLFESRVISWRTNKRLLPAVNNAGKFAACMGRAWTVYEFMWSILLYYFILYQGYSRNHSPFIIFIKQQIYHQLLSLKFK